jgi:SNF2 family DNA or RNA helicase
VVVSQWKSFLNIVQEHLKADRIRSTLFTGDLNTAKRQEIISDFNEEQGKIKVSLYCIHTAINIILTTYLLF